MYVCIVTMDCKLLFWLRKSNHWAFVEMWKNLTMFPFSFLKKKIDNFLPCSQLWYIGGRQHSHVSVTSLSLHSTAGRLAVTALGQSLKGCWFPNTRAVKMNNLSVPLSKTLNPDLLQGLLTTMEDPVKTNTFHCVYPLCDSKAFHIYYYYYYYVSTLRTRC